jgi:autotransporter passenger strand-loop-strand repeat protein
MTHVTYEYIDSGQTSSNLSVGDLEVLVVSGGVASDTTVLAGGRIDVSFGGSTFGDVVDSGGQEAINSGSAFSGTIERGATLNVGPGGVATDEAVNWKVSVYGGGALSGTKVASGGSVYLSSGATTVGDTLAAYTKELVSAGAGTTSGTIDSGALKTVYASGLSVDDLIAGEELVSSGSITGADILAGGELVLSGPAIMASTVVESGGLLLDHRVVTSGEVISVGPALAKATIDLGDVTLSSGAQMIVSGVTVLSGGVMSTLAGAVVSTATVSSGGALIGRGGAYGVLADAGLVSGASVHGQFFILSGGAASGVGVYGSGTILKGGAASGLSVRGGGDLTVSGAVTTLRISSGALADVRGVVSGAYIYSGGSATIDNGAVDGVTISAGGLLVASGGVTSGVSVRSGGELDVINNAAVSGVAVDPGGDEFFDYYVKAGATRSGDSIGSGAYVDNFGRMTSETIGFSGLADNRAIGSGTTVSAGGEEQVFVAASETGATLVGEAGAGLIVGSGSIGVLAGLQIVEGVAQHTVVSSGGYQLVVSNGQSISAGQALHTAILGGGVVEVDSRAILSGATIASGGELLLYNRFAKVTNLALNAGADIVLANQAATAASIVSGQLIVSSGSSVLDVFNLSGPTAGLGVDVSGDGAGGALLTITSAGAMAAPAARLRQALAALAMPLDGANRVQSGANPSSAVLAAHLGGR